MSKVEIAEEPARDNVVHEWFVSIEKKSNSRVRIPRVPEHLRSREEIKKCFNPTVVSLGPYHYENSNLKSSENLKLDAVKRYTNSTINSHANAALCFEEFCQVVAEFKEYYDIPKNNNIADDEFAWIMFMDCCFILDIIRQFTQEDSIQDNKGNDNKEPEMRRHDLNLVARDIILLENQVPLKLLQKLIDINKGKQSNTTGQVGTTDVINNKVVVDMTTIEKFIMKLLGFKDSINQNRKKDEPDESKSTDEYPHLLSLCRWKFLGTPIEKGKKTEGHPIYYRSIKELQEAGIVLQKTNDISPSVIKFTSFSFCGWLQLPQIILDDMTKYMFLNMIAYELGWNGPRDSDVISYICFMDSLIDHAEDVKILRKKNILLNALGSDQEVAELFNVLATDLSPEYSAHADVMGRIEKHCKNKFYYWLTNLYYTHFHSP